LPLLFGIIGGGAGFFAVQRSQNSGIVGVSLLFLTLMCLIGTIWGIRVRFQEPLRCFWSICTAPSSPAVLDFPPEPMDQEKLMLLLSVKVHLQNESFEAKDKERVFKIAKEDNVSDLTKLDKKLAVITKR